MTDIVVLENGHWQVGLLPTTGGSVAFGRVAVGGEWVDVLRPTPEDSLADVWSTASFPLVPWSNRIRDGAFTWAGKDYQLRVNFADGTAIHGTGIEFPWSVVAQTSTSVTLEFASRGVYGVNFPWPFTARFTYELNAERFTWAMEITNDAHETFPAGLGHHPYFVRELTTPSVTASEPTRLQVNCLTSYPVEGCLPTGPVREVSGRLDFREIKPLGAEFMDACYTARTSSTLATINYPGALTVDIEAGALLEHAVVYLPVGVPFFAVEPVTNANDGFNLEAASAEGSGVFWVQPGETRSTAFTLVAQPHT
jgi:aldose 1-epimerase